MRVVALLLTAALMTACAQTHAQSSSVAARTPAPAATLLADGRGVVMPLEKAVREIAFRPYVPRAQIVAVAAIPPLGGVDRRESHGIAIEYERDGEALLLSQWPRGRFEITVGVRDVTHRPCAPVAYKADGLLWTTRNGLVMTLQPDGPVPVSRIAREAHRLLTAGACGAGS